jgi:hypothetical protein
MSCPIILITQYRGPGGLIKVTEALGRRGAVMNGPTFEVSSYKPKLPSLIKINAYFEEATDYL